MAIDTPPAGKRQRSKRSPRQSQFSGRGTSLGLRATGTPQLIAMLDAGLPFRALQRFESNIGFSVTQLIGIPERTLARRRVAGRLTLEESERLLRVAQVFEQALRLFDGDAEVASRWLMTPRKALGGERPLDYSRTEPGAREVENLIGRIEHGVFA